MTKLKLGALADDKPVKVTREFPATLFRDLELYGRLLAGAGQPPIEPEKLIVPMLERFLATDREFQKATGRRSPSMLRLIPGGQKPGTPQRTTEDSMRAKRRLAHRGRPRRQAPQTLPEDLYDYGNAPAPPRQRRNSALENYSVTDDWPDEVPVTEAEIDVFERWFGDVFDELLTPKRPKDSLPILSQTDRRKA